MISTLLDPLLGMFTENPTRIGLGVSMLAVAFYYRRLLSLGLMVQNVLAYIVFGFVAVGVLVITGIVPTVNVGIAIELAWTVIETVRDTLPI